MGFLQSSSRPYFSPREKKPKAKIDPALVSKARELRDRYLERVNSNLAALASNAKYEVSRPLLAA